jgi:hypothetical protein
LHSTASTSDGTTTTRFSARGGGPAMIHANTIPVPKHAARRGRARPNSDATRTPSTDAGRSISVATAPLAMSSPISSIMRMFSATVDASDTTMYHVSCLPVYPATMPPFACAAARHSVATIDETIT